MESGATFKEITGKIVAAGMEAHATPSALLCGLRVLRGKIPMFGLRVY
jgi:hypothetical protein